jgi:hypothetical protein
LLGFWASEVVLGIGLLIMDIEKREQAGQSTGARTNRLHVEKRTVLDSTPAVPFRCFGPM